MPHLRPATPSDLNPHPAPQAAPGPAEEEAVCAPEPVVFTEPEPVFFTEPEEEDPDEDDADWPDAVADADMPTPVSVPLVELPKEKQRFPWLAVLLLLMSAAAYAAWYFELI